MFGGAASSRKASPLPIWLSSKTDWWPPPSSLEQGGQEMATGLPGWDLQS